MVDDLYPNPHAQVHLPTAPFLREMEESDITACVRLISRAMNLDEGAYARRSFDQHYKGLAHRIDDGRTFFVLDFGAKIIGIVGLHFYNWGPEKNVWLSWFAVDPDHQRHGWGTAMFRAIQTKAREHGYAKLLIETYSSETFAKARQFYAREGYENVGGISGYLPDGASMIVFARTI